MLTFITSCRLSNEVADLKSLLKHLKYCILVSTTVKCEFSTKIQRCDSQKIHRILNTIYASNSIRNRNHQILPKFVFEKTENIFISAGLVIKRLYYTLEPYYYSFDKLNYIENAWKLLHSMEHAKLSLVSGYTTSYAICMRDNRIRN